MLVLIRHLCELSWLFPCIGVQYRLFYCSAGSGTVVKYLPHHPKVKSLSLVTTNGTEEEKDNKYCFSAT